MSRRAGATLVELVIVLGVLSVIAAIAAPRYDSAVISAQAARVVTDMRQILVAAAGFEIDHNRWPDDVEAGILPPGLDRYLPAGVVMQTAEYTLDWENWEVPGGRVVGVAVTSDDPRLGPAIHRMLGADSFLLRIGDRYLFFTEPDGPTTEVGGGDDGTTDPDGGDRGWRGRGRPPWAGPPPGEETDGG